MGVDKIFVAEIGVAILLTLTFCKFGTPSGEMIAPYRPLTLTGGNWQK